VSLSNSALAWAQMVFERCNGDEVAKTSGADSDMKWSCLPGERVDLRAR